MAKGRARRAASAAGRGARALGKWSVQGAKGSAAAGAAGVATFFGIKILMQKVELARNHPVATPLAVAAGGHFLKRRYQSLGAGVVGAGAAMAAANFDAARQAKSGETSALTSASDIRALTAPGDIRGPLDAVDEVLETTGPEELYEGDTMGLGSAMSLEN
jgi:hypothetical protein